jgi:hypothetical protein
MTAKGLYCNLVDLRADGRADKTSMTYLTSQNLNLNSMSIRILVCAPAKSLGCRWKTAKKKSIKELFTHHLQSIRVIKNLGDENSLARDFAGAQTKMRMDIIFRFRFWEVSYDIEVLYTRPFARRSTVLQYKPFAVI